jgi:hypothetical protein
MRALVLAVAITTSPILVSARGPQRLDLVAIEGQPLSRAVIDQRECEAEFPYTPEESTLPAYAACLLARGYVSEVPLSASSGSRWITVDVRPDRAGLSLGRSAATSRHARALMLVERDYKGFRIQVDAVAADSGWNTEVRLRLRHVLQADHRATQSECYRFTETASIRMPPATEFALLREAAPGCLPTMTTA